MKPIISRLISITPIVVVVLVLTYIAEELLEDFVSEVASDFVYPIGTLIILLLVWYRVVPTIQAYLQDDTKQVSDGEENNFKP